MKILTDEQDTKMFHNWNITVMYASYVPKSTFIEFRTRKNISNDLKITKFGQMLAEGDPSLRFHGVGGHLGRHLGFWKLPTFELNSPSRSFLSCSYSCKEIQVVLINYCYLLTIHDDFHWQVTTKWFITEISLWNMALMFPKVFPLNPGPRKTHKKTQRSPKSVKRLQNEVHHCECPKLAAILDTSLESWWSWRPSWILEKSPKLNFLSARCCLSCRNFYKSNRAVPIY